MSRLAEAVWHCSVFCLLVLATENANCRQVRVAGKNELSKLKVRVPNIGTENALSYSKYFCLSSGQLCGRPRKDMEQKSRVDMFLGLSFCDFRIFYFG